MLSTGSVGNSLRHVYHLSIVGFCWIQVLLHSNIQAANGLSLIASTSTTTTSSAMNASRRQWLHSVHSSGGSFLGALALLQMPRDVMAAATTTAEEEGQPPSAVVRRRPTAPIEYLVPAAQIKVRIEMSLQAIAAAASSTPPSSKTTQQLRYLWLERPFLDTKLLLQQQQQRPSTSTAASSAQPAPSFQDRYTQNLQQLSLWQQPGAFLVQRGEVSAWQRLVRQEQSRATANPLRAAFNLYTDALVFSSQDYVLTVKDAREKSNMIRNNQLPTVTAVVTADLDIRTLYRNQILTCIDDVRAELQLDDDDDDNNNNEEGGVAGRTTSPQIDEVQRILQEANGAMDTWLSFIDPQEVNLALQGAQQAEDAWDVQKQH